MRVAFLGLGKMGAALAMRLVAGGHDVRGFDLSADAREQLVRNGGVAADTGPAASDGADAVVLCLPDAPAVEQVVDEVLAATGSTTSLWIDCTSSLPDVTRRLGDRLHDHGAALVDAPVTGGVSGALAGELTAIVGGASDDAARARPLLDCFAARVLLAGPLGSGHAAKAINNALSSASLFATAELVAAGEAAGVAAAESVDRINAGPARSQNSEVKFTRDVVTGRYGSGFAAGLMAKDVATASVLTRAVPIPLIALQRGLWRAAVGELGSDADFTRVYELATRWSPSAPGSNFNADVAVRACAAVLAIAAREALAIIAAIGLDRGAALDIINAGSGRTELTRIASGEGASAGISITEGLAGLDELLSASDAAAPLARLATELLRDAANVLGADNDLAALVTP